MKKAKQRRAKKKKRAAAAAKNTGVVREDKAAAYLAAWALEREQETEPDECRTDWNAYQARLYRDFWNKMYTRVHGSFEDTTSIPPMRFTDDPCDSAGPRDTLQIFSVKVAGIKEGLRWPLEVYGVMDVRDTVDHNRNIIFQRSRDNCQIFTEEDPYLALTGPSRAVVLSNVHHSYFEADLKLKGDTESNDLDFSYLSASCRTFIVNRRDITSRLSTLEVMVEQMSYSVEATISVKLVTGKWPHGSGGVFKASTAIIDGMDILLLAFGDDKLPVDDNGETIKLSRRVVSVELEGELKVSVQALPGTEEKDVIRGDLVFTPKRAGRSCQILNAVSCEMQVTVAWSLLSSYR